MLMSHGTMFMTALILLAMVSSLHWPAVVQGGGGGERCIPPRCIFIDVDVEINIKPGEEDEDLPSINPYSHGKIPVAVLSTNTFDASMVDLDAIALVLLGAAPVGIGL